MVLEYQIPKYDGDLGCQNVFIPLEAASARRKAKFLQRASLSKRDKHWFSEDTFLGLLRLRGVECATRYAEAFYRRKVVCP